MKLYIDTSVFGGYYEKEFQLWTRKLIDDVFDGEFTAVVSDIIPIKSGRNLKPHHNM